MWWWLIGSEWFLKKRKAQELKEAFLNQQGLASGLACQEWRFSLEEHSFQEVLDALQNESLGPLLGGQPPLKWVVIREAEMFEDLPGAEKLLKTLHQMQGTCAVLCLAQALDARKKMTAWVESHTRVIRCQPLREEERRSWVQRLATEHELVLSEQETVQWVREEPFSLGRVDFELQKKKLAGSFFEQSASSEKDSALWVKAFLSRNLEKTLALGHLLQAPFPGEYLKILGLLHWWIKQALQPASKRAPSWSSLWTFEEWRALQQALGEIEDILKSRSASPLGLWMNLALRFCRPSR